MSSTEPLTTSQPQSQAELNESATREAMEGHEGVRRLGFMAGIKSLHRNLKTEDESYARAMQVGDMITPDGNAGAGDDVDAMAARDITINHNYPAPASPMQPATPPVTTPPTSTLADKAKKAALIAAIAGGGSAVPLIYQYFNQKPAAAVVAPSDPAITALDLLPPDPAPGDVK